jgi:uncharacterized membrane protein
VSGAANAQVGNQQPTPEVFSYADIQNATLQTTSTYNFVGSLLGSLVGNLKMQVHLLGVGIVVPPRLTGAVSAALSPAAAPVDQLITSLLQTTGVGLGEAATWVTGANCASASLAG